MNFSAVTDNLPYLLLGAWPQGPLGGAALTLLISLASGLISAVLGLALGVGLALLRPGALRTALLAVLAFFRAIPVLMLVFWTYFLLPIVFGLNVPGLLTVVVALALVGAAYLAHSVHAGLQSLPAGQQQAALALGMTRWQAMRCALLPQALPIMLPSFVNQWIALIKDSSLAYVIGVAELSFVATQVSNRLMIYPAEIFLAVALIYYLICASLDVAAGALLKRQARKGWLGQVS